MIDLIRIYKVWCFPDLFYLVSIDLFYTVYQPPIWGCVFVLLCITSYYLSISSDICIIYR